MRRRNRILLKGSRIKEATDLRRPATRICSDQARSALPTCIYQVSAKPRRKRKHDSLALTLHPKTLTSQPLDPHPLPHLQVHPFTSLPQTRNLPHTLMPTNLPLLRLRWQPRPTICHHTHIRMTYSTVGEVDEHLTYTRFRGVDLFNFGANGARVVVDDGFVFGGDGGGHYCRWWIEVGSMVWCNLLFPQFGRSVTVVSRYRRSRGCVAAIKNQYTTREEEEIVFRSLPHV